MPRFTALTEASMTPRQREVAEGIAAGARGGLKGLNRSRFPGHA